MTTDQTAPATKQDISMLMEEIGKLYRHSEQWKNDLLDEVHTWRNDLHDEMRLWKNELKLHFDVSVEAIRFDLLHGAQADKLSLHDDALNRHDHRISVLERTSGRLPPRL